METDDNELDLEEDATMASLPALAAHLQLIAVNESIISLLLKLHHKLGSDAKSRSEQGQRRSVYRTPQELGQVSVPSCRIGDGVHFIGSYTVLHLLVIIWRLTAFDRVVHL